MGTPRYCLLIWRWLCCVALFTALNLGAEEMHIKLENVSADGATYTNVVVFTKSATHIGIMYPGGMATLKAKSLDTATQRKLGYLAPEEPKTALPPIATAASDPRLREMQERYQRNVEEFVQQLDKRTLYQILTLIGIIYLFFCHCCWQICRKTSNHAGIFVWLPGFQMIPLLRAAGMSPWLFLTLFLPVVGWIVMIIWCFRIARVRQKGVLTALLLLFPVTSPIAFVYLALSGYGPEGERERDEGNGKIKLGFQST
jgi:hypothetical protein